jgi:hypothetical protein
MATNITSVQSGIIFLMAEWSGQAKWAFTRLEDFLFRHQLTSGHLICIDVDHEPSICNLPELAGKIHGYGEAAVIKNGKIIFVTTLGKDKDQINNRLEELLQIYRA